MDIITTFIHWLKSYKEMKKDLMNMSTLLKGIESKKILPIVEGKKNLKEKKIKKKKKNKSKT